MKDNRVNKLITIFSLGALSLILLILRYVM